MELELLIRLIAIGLPVCDRTPSFGRIAERRDVQSLEEEESSGCADPDQLIFSDPFW